MRFGPKRAPKSAFSYCFVDVVPPKPLRERRFGAWTRVFENEKRECTSSMRVLPPSVESLEFSFLLFAGISAFGG